MLWRCLRTSLECAPDLSPETLLGRIDQRDRHALVPGTRSAPGPVHIRVGGAWNLEVHDVIDALDVDAVIARTKYLVGTYGRLVGQEAIQLHGGIGMTAEYAVGHYTSRLATIERTFGDTRQHLASLAANVGDHASVDVV